MVEINQVLLFCYEAGKGDLVVAFALCLYENRVVVGSYVVAGVVYILVCVPDIAVVGYEPNAEAFCQRNKKGAWDCCEE